MKPTIRKVKDVRGRITGHKASIGPVDSGQWATPAIASEECERLTLEALARLDRGAHTFVWRGHAIVTFPTLHGWSYWIDTSSPGFTCASHHGATREACDDDALHHLAQNVWTHDADDASFCDGLPRDVAAKIRDWIGFQRAYVVAESRGMVGNEAHRWACENRGAA